ncbi:hypothetical protein B0T22DRAFT_302723 [Podospora appendiculata]|uniref:Uncharacterized protein n=1 Tax=Podospora appendiculata TaxID=314037 RepID=A0AAE1C7A8_9PEZI|nr:hypothetical protein B0T22DRAFT_302723 [Podospora appendiculata]
MLRKSVPFVDLDNHQTEFPIPLLIPDRVVILVHRDMVSRLFASHQHDPHHGQALLLELCLALRQLLGRRRRDLHQVRHRIQAVLGLELARHVVLADAGNLSRRRVVLVDDAQRGEHAPLLHLCPGAPGLDEPVVHHVDQDGAVRVRADAVVVFAPAVDFEASHAVVSIALLGGQCVLGELQSARDWDRARTRALGSRRDEFLQPGLGERPTVVLFELGEQLGSPKIGSVFAKRSNSLRNIMVAWDCGVAGHCIVCVSVLPTE